MNKKSTTLKHSLSEIVSMRERGLDKTRHDAPHAESLGEDFWKSARVVFPPGKTSVHLCLDSDVVEWFKSHGKGHLTRMNAVLRAYADTQNRCA
jgi:uncharacterized protein (DUF4415 family)